jgi:hypothetical protein
MFTRKVVREELAYGKEKNPRGKNAILLFGPNPISTFLNQGLVPWLLE